MGCVELKEDCSKGRTAGFPAVPAGASADPTINFTASLGGREAGHCPGGRGLAKPDPPLLASLTRKTAQVTMR